uniref:Secreted protein n=1 Tax=Panagrolaimus sp. JU765 TaxID=591449 RepID=A0AC34RQC1_9BILA
MLRKAVLNFVFVVFVFDFIQCHILNSYRRDCPIQNCPQQQFTCPCKKASNSSRCFAYDNTLQATTIDEAIFSFPDMSDPSPTRSTMVSSSQPSTMSAPSVSSFAGPQMMAAAAVQHSDSDGDRSCNSGACAGCKYWVIQGFAKSYNATIKQSRQQ